MRDQPTAGRASLAWLTALVVVASSPASAGATVKDVDGFVGGARGVFSGGMFTEPSDVAVYRGGAGGPRKLLVAEAVAGRNSRVQRLDAHGNFELAWGRDTIRAGAPGDRGRGFEICRAAVSGSRGCKAAPPGGRPGELRMPTALAVSQATGDVYVMDMGNHRVQRFDHDGRFVAAWGWGVATGADRSEVCVSRCQPGHVGGDGRDAGPGQLAVSRPAGRSSWASTATGAIAISPASPHHVFVGDEGNDRVLEFTSRGRFVRAWGWGVATGSRRFEECVGDCRPGRHSPGGDGWPRHLAVGADGVVYGSDAVRDGSVVRFRAMPPPPSSDASAALLRPFTVDDALSGGFSRGLALDPATGTLAVARDPFGPMVVDEIQDPASARPPVADAPRSRVLVQDRLPFLGSVNGIDSADGTVYLAKSTWLDPNDPDAGLTECALKGRSRPCNGVVELSPPGELRLALLGASRDRRRLIVSGAVAPGGVVRVGLQVSADGRVWRRAGRERYVSGGRYVSFMAPLASRSGIVKVRLVATATTRGGQSAISNALTAVTSARDARGR